MEDACWIIGAAVLVVVLSWLCPDAASGEIRVALRKREQQDNAKKFEKSKEQAISLLNEVLADKDFNWPHPTEDCGCPACLIRQARDVLTRKD